MSPTVITRLKLIIPLLFISLFVFTSMVSGQSTPVLAFPGAEGFGKYTSGGRGGKVFIVTNLNDSGPGSLREAVEAKGARTVVFEVSGNINLNSILNVRDGNLTIAGQTAPGDGITITNYPLNIRYQDNIIIRFIRIRMGDLSQREEDSFEAQYSNNLIIDHCSFSWGTDETCSIYNVKNTTLQNSIISEGLNDSYHSKGLHGYGSLIAGNGFSLYQNLWTHFHIRNPSISSMGERGIIDLRNNVMYNWGQRSTDNGSSSTVNLFHNFYKPGPASFKRGGNTPLFFLWPTGSDYGKFYLEGNKLLGKQEIASNQWLGVRLENSEKTELYLELCKNKDENGKLVPFPVPNGTYSKNLSADEAYEEVLRHAGASLVRDLVDQRLIEEVRTGTTTFKGSKTGLLGIIDSQNDVGGWPVLKSTAPPKDTDRDGMPDYWEVENGLNPNLADHNGYTLSNTYTNIEVYINSLVKHISEPDAVVSPSTPQLESPLNNAVGFVKTTPLKWKNAPNAQSYQIQVSKTQDFGTLVANIDNLNSLEYLVPNLEDNTQYFWRVKAKNNSGTSTWSPVWNFKTLQPLTVPEIPKPVSPVNGSTDLSNTVLLEWSKVANAKTYRLQVARDPGFTSMVYDIYNLPGQSIELKNLASGASFAWRVRATNDAGSSNFSEAWTFTTNTTSIPVTGITVSPEKASLEISKSLQLTVSISPTNASNNTVNWNSSNPDVASISSTGLVTGIKSGIAILTATSQDGNFTATSEITVTNNVAIGIAGITLVNADTNMDIIGMSNEMVLDSKEIFGQNLNFRVNTNPETVGSVWISLAGPVNQSRTENIAPYALFGDNNGNYNGMTLPEGDYIIEAIPYSEPSRGGIKGTSLSIQFSIAEKVVVPAPPLLTSPADKSTGLATNLKLTWTAITNAESYTLELSKNQDFSSLVTNNSALTNNEFTVSGLLEDTQYYWRVRATNSAGNSPYSTVWTFRTIKSVVAPAVPTLVSPSNGAKDLSLSPNLQWNLVTGTKTYRIQVSKESSFATVILDDPLVVTNTLQVNKLEEGITYYWRVSASNEAGSSSFSPTWSFQTKITAIAPDVPVLVSPADKSTGLATNLKLTWTAITNAESYTLELSKNQDFSSLVTNNSALTNNEFTVSGLEDGTIYYWRVYASNATGSSEWSAVWSFSTKEKVNPPSPPQLLGPANESAGLTGKTLFTWTKSETAAGYGLQISKDQNFGVKHVDLSNISTESTEVLNLEKGVSYFWRVYAFNEGGSSSYSEVWTFETLGLPNVPALISPINGKKDLAVNLTLVWGKASGADSYRLQVSKAKDFSQNLIDRSGLTETSFNLENLEEGMTYYWRVRASNAAGNSSYAATWEFGTEKPLRAPITPQLLSPTSGAIMNIEDIVLEWKAVEQAERYQVQVSKYSNFSQSIVFDYNTINNNTVAIEDLEPNEVYFWRVMAINIAGSSPYSAVWNFITLPLPPLDAPILISPGNSALIDTTSVEFTWNSVAEAENYQLEVSSESNFKTQSISFTQILENKFRVDSLEKGKTYYWKVTANGKRPSSQSQVWSFKIEEEKDLLQSKITPVTIKTYPNPFNDRITMEFSRSIEGEVTISIFDNKGISVFENKVSDLMENITIEVPPGLPKGIYVIKVQGFGVFESKRVIKN